MKRTAWFLTLTALLGLAWAPVASAQGPNIKTPLPFDEMAKLFGTHDGFTATALVTVTEGAGAKPVKMTLPLAYRDGKFRSVVNMAEAMGAAGEGGEGAAMAQMVGLDKMITLADTKSGQAWLILPALKAYTKMPVNSGSAAGSEAPGKVVKTKVGAETVEGQACTKYRITVTPAPAGDTSETYLWECAALKNFPVKMELVDTGTHAVILYRQVSFTKPAADLCVLPAGYKAYGTMQEMMMSAVQNMMMQQGGAN